MKLTVWIGVGPGGFTCQGFDDVTFEEFHRTSQLVRGRIGCLKKKRVPKLQQSRRKWYHSILRRRTIRKIYSLLGGCRCSEERRGENCKHSKYFNMWMASKKAKAGRRCEKAKSLCCVCCKAVEDGKDEALLCEGQCQKWLHRYCAVWQWTNTKNSAPAKSPFSALPAVEPSISSRLLSWEAKWKRWSLKFLSWRPSYNPHDPRYYRTR